MSNQFLMLLNKLKRPIDINFTFHSNGDGRPVHILLRNSLRRKFLKAKHIKGVQFTFTEMPGLGFIINRNLTLLKYLTHLKLSYSNQFDIRAADDLAKVFDLAEAGRISRRLKSVSLQLGDLQRQYEIGPDAFLEGVMKIISKVNESKNLQKMLRMALQIYFGSFSENLWTSLISILPKAKNLVNFGIRSTLRNAYSPGLFSIDS